MSDRTPIFINWYVSHRADPRARPLADRHYNRQKIGAPQFAPPGRALVLLADGPDGEPAALWITSWPFAQYVKHAWAGAWVCSCFRNERHPWKSSALIREAVAVTQLLFGPPAGAGVHHLRGHGQDQTQEGPRVLLLDGGLASCGRDSWRPRRAATSSRTGARHAERVSTCAVLLEGQGCFRRVMLHGQVR